jgi:hypothetical protein
MGPDAEDVMSPAHADRMELRLACFTCELPSLHHLRRLKLLRAHWGRLIAAAATRVKKHRG